MYYFCKCSHFIIFAAKIKNNSMAKTERIGFEQVNSLLQTDHIRFESKPFVVEGLMLVNGNNNLIDILQTGTAYILEDTRILIVVKGEAEIEINLQKHTIRPGMVLLMNPGAIVKMLHLPEDYTVSGLMISPTLLSSIFDEYMPKCVSSGNNCSILQPDCVDWLATRKMYQLLWELCGIYGFQKRIAYPLIRALIEQVNLVFTKAEDLKPLTRSGKIYDKFMRLVAENGAREHGIEFYAERLYVTNNYLSSIVKQNSGLTAKEWIDKAIITQAKMLLKTTDLQNAQIAHRLNFPNPSFFNRFFKRLTGMTPVEYKNK